MTPGEPQACPHGVQWRKREHLCAGCMEAIIDAKDTEIATLRAERDRAWKITGKDGTEVSGPTMVERIGALQDANAALRAELASVREDARGLALRMVFARRGHGDWVCQACGHHTTGEHADLIHAGNCPVARSLTPGATVKEET